MAMRATTRGGAMTPSRNRSAGVQPVYEIFRPMSEWQQDEESNVLLLIYLPGFSRQRLKVSTEGRNIVRVSGERLVGGNKWSRLQEDYQVPEDCNMSGIHAKFSGGTLTITMPRKKKQVTTPSTTAAGKEIVQKSSESSKLQDEDKSSKTSDELKTAKRRNEEEEARLYESPIKSRNHEKSKGESRDREHDRTISQTKEQVFEPLLKSQKHRKPDEEIDDRDRMISETKKQVFEPPLKPQEHKKSSDESRDRDPEREPDPVISETKEQVFEPSLKSQKHNKSEKESRDPKRHEMILETKVEKTEDRGIDQYHIPTKTNKEVEPNARPLSINDQSVEAASASTTVDQGRGSHKKAVKSLMELNEERQLLVNVGVAVLVIVALGAYVSYTFGSRGEA